MCHSVSLLLELLDKVVLHLRVLLGDSAICPLLECLGILAIFALLHFLEVSMDLFRFSFELGLTCCGLVVCVSCILSPHLSHECCVLSALISQWGHLLIQSLHCPLYVTLLTDLMNVSLESLSVNHSLVNGKFNCPWRTIELNLNSRMMIKRLSYSDIPADSILVSILGLQVLCYDPITQILETSDNTYCNVKQSDCLPPS